MSKFIPKSEYMDSAPVRVGAQVHVNHRNCPAGTDRRRRLYIKRLSPHVVVAFCHHCGKRGSNKKFSRESLVETVDPVERVLWNLPKDFTKDLALFPGTATWWITRYVPMHVATEAGIGYSENMRRVIIPIWKDGKLSCYQARRIYADDIKPKYLTFKNDSNPFFLRDNGGDMVVLVEDVLSALVLGVYGYSAIAMLGTYCSNTIVNHIITHYSKVVVMLDDNNIDVKKQALRIQNQLNLFLPPVLVAKTNGRDPKSMRAEEIETCILESSL